MPSLKIGLQATAFYIAVVALGMIYVYVIRAEPYGTALMVSHFWVVELILCGIVLYYIIRYFGWSGVGFGRINWRATVWMLPAYMVLGAMLLVQVPKLMDGSLTAAEWSLLGWLTLTTFMIGFSEEVMFRGILLRGALTRLSVVQAMVLSAALFALMHAVNVLAGQPFENTLQQLAFTFLVGFFLAPIALKIGNLWPLIIWHWLWDLVLFSTDVLGGFQPFAFLGLLFQAVISLWLWREVMQKS